MKKSLYAIAWVSLLTINQVSAINAGEVSNPNLVTAGRADEVIQRWIVNAMTFLVLAAVIYWLWWGFNILTAWQDEEKVKNWKNIIVNSLIWVVVIFLVGTIVRFLIDAILT